MSIDLRIYNFDGMSFRKLLAHDNGMVTFIATVAARETVSNAKTETQIDLTMHGDVAERFERAMLAFNAEFSTAVVKDYLEGSAL
jgi:ABC-type transporter lipoprotein component MlaA